MITSLEWFGTGVRFIDQTKLPLQECIIETSDYRVVADAIRTMRIRGAPLIGIAAAYGVALAAVSFHGNELSPLRDTVCTAITELSSTRPTAVNLFHALQRMQKVLNHAASAKDARSRLVEEAVRIHHEDEEMCELIGEHGAKLISQSAAILTHCNTGALATGGKGTALGIIAAAHQQGKSIDVFVDETRPALQGARLTAWELRKHGIKTTLITDSTAAVLLRTGDIDLVIVGADRIAANGDTANKIGTYSLAISAHHHGVPFYVAAPSSTIDPSIASGEEIPIEQRSEKEVTEVHGHRFAPEGISVFAPAFDVTPAPLITAIVTERGIHRHPFHFT